MLGTVVSTVKECSDEVKDSIKYFQQNIEQVSDTSNEKFSALANSSKFILLLFLCWLRISQIQTGLYNSYQLPLALASKETFFTHKQKNVTCQINKDTNWYYTTSICSYSWIIINSLRQKMISWGMGFCWYHIETFFMFQTFIS